MLSPANSGWSRTIPQLRRPRARLSTTSPLPLSRRPLLSLRRRQRRLPIRALSHLSRQAHSQTKSSLRRPLSLRKCALPVLLPWPVSPTAFHAAVASSLVCHLGTFPTLSPRTISQLSPPSPHSLGFGPLSFAMAGVTFSLCSRQTVIARADTISFFPFFFFLSWWGKFYLNQ